MSVRRKLVQQAQTGVMKLGVEGAQALMEVPLLAAQVLEEKTDGPVAAFMAMGHQEVAELQAFMVEQQGHALWPALHQAQAARYRRLAARHDLSIPLHPHLRPMFVALAATYRDLADQHAQLAEVLG